VAHVLNFSIQESGLEDVNNRILVPTLPQSQKIPKGRHFYISHGEKEPTESFQIPEQEEGR